MEDRIKLRCYYCGHVFEHGEKIIRTEMHTINNSGLRPTIGYMEKDTQMLLHPDCLRRVYS
jgi:hypothetical protein